MGAPFGSGSTASYANSSVSNESTAKITTSHDQYRIFNDEPKIGTLALNYDRYVETISNIILNSYPPYTIGIFGSWGTGKSSVMKNVKSKIDGKCALLEFNAWRFEREETHATIPLLITIIATLYDKLKKENPSTLKKADSKGVSLGQKILGVLKGLTVNFKVGIPAVGEFGVEYDFANAEFPDNGKKSDVARSTFHEGVDLIKELLDIIEPLSSTNNLKLVVLIDDLDRCTPEKTIEVFESVKVFLNIENIVFVLALSQEIVEMAVDIKYHQFKELFSGKDYLKKIIQLPVMLPIWNESQIIEFLEYILNNYENNEFKKIFEDKDGKKNPNKRLIAKAVESNPREVIRLLNNFIFAKQILQDSAVDPGKLLAVQAIRMRWPDFYNEIKDNPDALDRIRGVIK